MKRTVIPSGEQEVAGGEQRMVLPVDMLALVSHEMRTPLTAISGYATTLLRHAARLTPEEHQEFLLAIMSAGKRLEHIVDLLMELTYVETLPRLTDRLPVNVLCLMDEAVTALPQEMSQTPAGEERVMVPSPVAHNERGVAEVAVLGDHVLLRHLLDHLLDNALRFSTSYGLVELRITPQRVQDVQQRLALNGTYRNWYLAVPPPAWLTSSSLVEIQIRDRGPGIAPDHLPTIFQRFSQVEQQFTREHEGLGLGLAICKRIVELHEGMLVVESMPGVGSTFYVTLRSADA